MITVKLYGLLRIDSGIKEQQIEAGSIREVLEYLSTKGILRQDLDGCIILVNGKAAGKRAKLHSGDLVQLLSPVAGG